MRPTAIDFHRIKAEHEGIHLRLENWARVYRDRPTRAMARSAPMWRNTRNSARLFNPPPAVAPPDYQDAQQMEQRVCKLPYYHREVICWAYLQPSAPAKMARELHVSYETLYQLLSDARQLLAFPSAAYPTLGMCQETVST